MLCLQILFIITFVFLRFSSSVDKFPHDPDEVKSPVLTTGSDEYSESPPFWASSTKEMQSEENQPKSKKESRIESVPFSNHSIPSSSTKAVGVLTNSTDRPSSSKSMPNKMDYNGTHANGTIIAVPNTASTTANPLMSESTTTAGDEQANDEPYERFPIKPTTYNDF